MCAGGEAVNGFAVIGDGQSPGKPLVFQGRFARQMTDKAVA